jgi:hypothetical protein
METTLTTPFPVLATASWAAAIVMLVRSWLSATTQTRSTMDGPQLLLTATAPMLPDNRGDWGAAMSAELAQLRSPSARWSFALGCTRVALLPPNSRRPWAIAVAAAAVTATAVVGVAVGRVLPAVQVFAVTFTALVGVLATVAVNRGRRPTPARPGAATTAAMLAGVAGCIVIFAYVAVRYPLAVYDPTRGFSVLFAAVLTLYVWLALRPPRFLTTSRLGRRTGVGTAVVIFGLGYSLVAVNSYDGQLMYLLAGLFIGIPGCAVAAGAIGGRRRDGVEAAVWMGLVSGMLIFAVHTLVPILGFQLDAAILDEGYPPGVRPDISVWLSATLGREIGGGIFALLLLPGWALFVGLVAGACGSAAREGFDEPLPRP